MPSPETVEKALELIRKRPANHDYFFSKLTSPDWIEPLDKAGLFLSPPAVMRDGDSVSYPFWPESDYLARVASEAPEQVAEVMMKIPATDNFRVHADLARAAASLPAKLAARWAKEESAWVARQEYLSFVPPEAWGALIAHLAQSGEENVAISLARSLLSFHVGDGTLRHRGAILESWDYQQILQNRIPELVRNSGLEGLALLCDLLENAISAEDGGRPSSEEYSWIWRQAIEPHEQNFGQHEPRNALVDSLRDSSVQLLETGAEIQEVIGLLCERERPIFKRIAIHLLVETRGETSQVAARFVVDRENFFSLDLRHEYTRLLTAVFPELNDDEKSEILEWVEAGPLLGSSTVDDEELHRTGKAYWQAERLSGLRPHLPPPWEERYKVIVDELGEPEHPDFLSPVRMWTGPTSPKETHDLEEMSAKDISEFLKTWKPSGAPAAPEPEGLGRALRSVVGSSPDRFVAALDSMRGLHPTYARAIVEGLAEAVKQDAPIAWRPVIHYMEWITEQPRTRQETTEETFGRDPHWGWARKEAASLLSTGFQKDAVDYDLREAAWRLVDAIADDPDPTPERDETEAMDPATQSLNTTRGQALHAAVRYAMWVSRHVEKVEPESRSDAFSLDRIPEARRCLERHLDPTTEQSLSVRAVFGMYLPNLVRLDREWVEANLGAIFSKEQPSLRDAAWNTYLAFHRVYKVVFDLVRDQYDGAVERLAEEREAEEKSFRGSGERPVVSLGQHLLTLVGRGVLSWSDEDGLVQRFFINAPTKDATRATTFVGWSLERTQGDIPVEHLERFQRFWEELSDFVSNSAEDRKDILKAYGWWFVSGRFDTSWSLDHLERVIEEAGGVDLDYEVTERLAELAGANPARSLSALKALCQDERSWYILSSKDSARRILQAALAQEATRSDAQHLIHLLGARGHLQFRDLLTE